MISPDRRTIKPIHQPTLDAVDQLFTQFPHRKEIKIYGHKRILTNGMWCDLLCHNIHQAPVLRVSRGARLVRQHPILHGLFDEVMIVVAKLSIPSIQTIEDKNLHGLITLLDQAPAKIGAFD